MRYRARRFSFLPHLPCLPVSFNVSSKEIQAGYVCVITVFPHLADMYCMYMRYRKITTRIILSRPFCLAPT